jgi:hypothetical protein
MIQEPPHDAHLRDCVEIFDGNGTLLERHYGSTEQETKDAHDRHECHAFCGYCYWMGCEEIDNLNYLRLLNASHGPTMDELTEFHKTSIS